MILITNAPMQQQDFVGIVEYVLILIVDLEIVLFAEAQEFPPENSNGKRLR